MKCDRRTPYECHMDGQMWGLKQWCVKITVDPWRQNQNLVYVLIWTWLLCEVFQARMVDRMGYIGKIGPGVPPQSFCFGHVELWFSLWYPIAIRQKMYIWSENICNTKIFIHYLIVIKNFFMKVLWKIHTNLQRVRGGLCNPSYWVSGIWGRP